MHYKCVEICRAVNIRHPSTSRKAKTLWKRRDAKEDGEENHDKDSGDKLKVARQ